MKRGLQATTPDKLQEDLESCLATGKEFDDIAEFLNVEWPEEIYSKTHVDTGSPIKANKDWDTAIVLDTRDKTEKGIVKEMAKIYPDIAEVVGQGMQEGHLEFVQNITKTITSKRGTEERTNFIYLLPQEIDIKGVNDIKILYNMLRELKELQLKNGRNKVVITSTEGLNRAYVRKLIEFVFHNTNVNIVYLIPRGKNLSTAKIKPQQGARYSEKRESVLVKAGGRSYAELLREVKNKVDVRKLGIELKQVKKTQAGDLLLVNYQHLIF